MSQDLVQILVSCELLMRWQAHRTSLLPMLLPAGGTASALFPKHMESVTKTIWSKECCL